MLPSQLDLRNGSELIHTWFCAVEKKVFVVGKNANKKYLQTTTMPILLGKSSYLRPPSSTSQKKCSLSSELHH